MTYKKVILAGMTGTVTFLFLPLNGYIGSSASIAGDTPLQSNTCQRVRTIETDIGVDGTIDQRQITSLGYRDQPLSICHDTDLNGVFDITTLYTYDAQYRTVEVFNEVLGVKSRTTITYNVAGKTESELIDMGADGSVDRSKHYLYNNQNGDLFLLNEDENGDTITDKCSYFSYFQGHLTSIAVDRGADGITDSITSYTYDGNGNRITEENDKDADGTPDSLIYYTYNGNGNMLTKKDDTDANGSIDAITTYTYAANNYLLSITDDTNADGIADSIIKYTYNQNGDRIKDEFDNDCNGIIDIVNTYSYQGGPCCANQCFRSSFLPAVFSFLLK
jgi:serralysin